MRRLQHSLFRLLFRLNRLEEIVEQSAVMNHCLTQILSTAFAVLVLYGDLLL